jgi:RNA polymerase sigma factor (TIGR02999 family)
MSQQDVTAWLLAWGRGNADADDRLIDAVYADLRKVARGRLRAERADHSLTPTALVHEAYVRLVDLRRVRWQNRAQFFAIAARLMRRVLVDHARVHGAVKRGGAAWRVPLSEVVDGAPRREVDIFDLEAAMTRLGTIDARLTDIVVMRFFGGLTVEETAEVLGSSPATVKRDWTRARAWLFRELRHADGGRSGVTAKRGNTRRTTVSRANPRRVERTSE